MRHKFSVGCNGDIDAGLYAGPVPGIWHEAAVAHRSVAGNHGPELRVDPLRRQAAWLVPGVADRAGPLAATHHDAAPFERSNRGCHLRARSRNGPRTIAGRATHDRLNVNGLRAET